MNKDVNELDDKFSMMFELEDIESVEDIGLVNMVDISVRGNETFHLANGLISHNSASGGLIPALGRDGIGYYELKGNPLNAYSATQQKFTGNPELSELYSIIRSEGYTKCIFGTDQDLDGFSIRGLLIGFFHRYLPELLHGGDVGMLSTPIMASRKKGGLIKWVYKLSDKGQLDNEKDVKYYKGLGSWTVPELKQVLKTDGMDKMIDFFEWDDEADEAVDAWLNTKRSDDRKEFLRNNSFDIAKA